MGVLNVTPDSFSDGGLWFDTGDAVAHGFDLLAQGADIVDVGGESTRPGSVRVDEAEELRRVVPVTRELAAAGVVVSVDTMRASVAEAAIEAGAALINDVSAGQMDSDMLGTAARTGAPIVLMHWRGLLERADASYHYTDVAAEVRAELSRRVEVAVEAGVRPAQIVLDPGPGFSKNAGHNWQLLAHLEEFLDLPFPFLVAVSRKKFLSTLLAPGPDAAASVADRDSATAAVTTLAARAGAWAVRVHEPRASRIAAEVARAVTFAAASDRDGETVPPPADTHVFGRNDR
ncbi:dihydropteroate synthase [Brevibacterium litoralis]|uniref:dihydropteroate synthase n=1 Tax=Brevibacterium litoralis TaxID=3138935 RepID=UPI0032EF7729